MAIRRRPPTSWVRSSLILKNRTIFYWYARLKGLDSSLLPGPYKMHTNSGMDQVISDLEARVWQHETDHLHGILFIDRMDKASKEEIRPELDELQAATKAELQGAKASA